MAKMSVKRSTKTGSDDGLPKRASQNVHQFQKDLNGKTLLLPVAQKRLGAFYTPLGVARALVAWVVRDRNDRLLDPACGDGRFLAAHWNSVGVECEVSAVVAAAQRSHGATIHVAEFFSWAEACRERFDCAAGNPPFIRYQHFSGTKRETALRLCARLGAEFSGLTSSWAPFLVACSGLLKPGGRMAFVVPAEIGHAPYARPLVLYLATHFAKVLVLAVRRKLFPDLSEDVWLLYADGFGSKTDRVLFSQAESFHCDPVPPRPGESIPLADWKTWNLRLRPYLLSRSIRAVYEKVRGSADAEFLATVARVGIGYVTGANGFFHLRPSQAKLLGIPDRYLVPSVRSGKWLNGEALTPSRVRAWLERDEPVLLLRLPKDQPPESRVQDYLDSSGGKNARATFKCRNRSPWYVVPDVRVPDAFLSYMSGEGPQLVANEAGCPCTNSIHAVCLNDGWELTNLEQMWSHPLTRLSCELEGHPLGGGMLKLEPGEVARVVLPGPHLRLSARDLSLIQDGIETMRRWRHYE